MRGISQIYHYLRRPFIVHSISGAPQIFFDLHAQFDLFGSRSQNQIVEVHKYLRTHLNNDEYE